MSCENRDGIPNNICFEVTKEGTWVIPLTDKNNFRQARSTFFPKGTPAGISIHNSQEIISTEIIGSDGKGGGNWMTKAEGEPKLLPAMTESGIEECLRKNGDSMLIRIHQITGVNPAEIARAHERQIKRTVAGMRNWGW